MILIGSKAIQYHINSWRAAADTDFVGTYEEVEQHRKKQKTSVRAFYPISNGASFYMSDIDKNITELEVAWEGSRAEKLVKFVEAQQDNVVHEDCIIPSLDVLYMLKMSHRYLKDSPHFKKTLDDILLLRKYGAKIRPEHEEFYKERMADTYVNKLPKLNQSKDGFFGADTGVEYKYDHDTIHEAVKHLDRPAYTYFQDGEVWCSKALWDKQDYTVKLFAAYEEACVLAIERSLVPFPGKKTPKEAFDMAYMKLATSISSGWFREFVWEHYYQVQNIYSDEYFDKFKRGLEQGVVKPHKED